MLNIDSFVVGSTVYTIPWNNGEWMMFRTLKLAKLFLKQHGFDAEIKKVIIQD